MASIEQAKQWQSINYKLTESRPIVGAPQLTIATKSYYAIEKGLGSEAYVL
jgi:hypothetical protein